MTSLVPAAPTRGDPSYVERQKIFVKIGILHSALREWRDEIRQMQTLAILGGVAVVLGVSGPFGTSFVLPLVPRIIYWLAVTFATYSTGSIASGMAVRLIDGRLSRWAEVLVVAFAIGTAVLATVTLINVLAFGLRPQIADVIPGAFSIYAIALVIAVVFSTVEQHKAPDNTPLLDRLPFDKRGPLIAITVEDHYVHIRTTKGVEMVLMRLSDAMRETGATAGLQVHRSHWVALDQVTAAHRQGDGARLTMSDGTGIPVSRANVAKLKEAGLLP